MGKNYKEQSAYYLNNGMDEKVSRKNRAKVINSWIRFCGDLGEERYKRRIIRSKLSDSDKEDMLELK